MIVKDVTNIQICGLWPNQVHFEKLSAPKMCVFQSLMLKIPTLSGLKSSPNNKIFAAKTIDLCLLL